MRTLLSHSFLLCFSLLLLATSCIREEEFDNTPKGNFEALWQVIDEHYCFFDEKEIDWDEIGKKYFCIHK